MAPVLRVGWNLRLAGDQWRNSSRGLASRLPGFDDSCSVGLGVGGKHALPMGEADGITFGRDDRSPDRIIGRDISMATAAFAASFPS